MPQIDNSRSRYQRKRSENPGILLNLCKSGRDRAGAYAEAVRVGAPNTVQVADRWHLWHNLVGAVEDTVVRHRADLRPPTEPVDPGEVVTDTTANEIDCGTSTTNAEWPDGRLITRTRERHATVQQLVSNGMTISAISRKRSLDRKTVRRFARAHDVDELLTTTRIAGPTLLSEHETYLRDRFAAGCTDATRLTAEITDRGYRGSAKTVRRFLAPLRVAHRTRPAPPPAPSARQVTGWLTSRPDRLTDADSRRLTDILERSPALTALREHVRGFAEIMVERRGLELISWMTSIDATGSPALRSFAAGLRRDLDAVTAGLTLEHNSGPVEGHVNRIKMLKAADVRARQPRPVAEARRPPRIVKRGIGFTESVPDPLSMSLISGAGSIGTQHDR